MVLQYSHVTLNNLSLCTPFFLTLSKTKKSFTFVAQTIFFRDWRCELLSVFQESYSPSKGLKLPPNTLFSCVTKLLKETPGVENILSNNRIDALKSSLPSPLPFLPFSFPSSLHLSTPRPIPPPPSTPSLPLLSFLILFLSLHSPPVYSFSP